MTILVLGGAGYIGSHAVDQLVQKGYQVAVVDNLLTGHKQAVHPDAHFYEGDIRDKEFLRSVFEKEPLEQCLRTRINRRGNALCCFLFGRRIRRKTIDVFQQQRIRYANLT